MPTLRGGGQGWEMAPTGSFVSEEAMPPLPMCSKKREKSLPVHLRQSSDCGISLWGYLHAFSPGALQHSQGSIQQCCGPLRFQSLSSIGCNNSGKSTSLIFLVNDFREAFFLRNPLCALLSAFLVSLCDQRSLPSVSPMICFSLKPSLHTSYLP